MNFFKNRINFKECVFLPSVFHKKANEKNFDLNSLLLFCPPPTNFCKLFMLTEQELKLIRNYPKEEISTAHLHIDGHSTVDDPVQSELVSCNLFGI